MGGPVKRRVDLGNERHGQEAVMLQQFRPSAIVEAGRGDRGDGVGRKRLMIFTGTSSAAAAHSGRNPDPKAKPSPS